jgi:hypothetical protein
MTASMPEQEPQAHSELASFGEELRREREIRGISLKEIADATKISKRFLDAIERNDHRTLPAPVFTRGFIREYARYLGLNCEEMVNRYNFAAAGDDRIEKTPHLERLATMPPPDLPREPAKKRGIPPAYARIDRGVYLLILIVAALSAMVWWAVQHKRRLDMEAARAEAVRAVPVHRVVQPPPVVATPPPPKAEEPLRLIIELTDDCYLDLEVDGQTVLKDSYRRGTRDTFEAKNNFTFKRIGNAAGVILMLNDKQLPPLGDDGEVIKNRVYDRVFVEKLTGQ